MSVTTVTERIAQLESLLVGRPAAQPARATSFGDQLAAAATAPPAAAAGDSSAYDGLIDAAAARNGVDPALLRGLIRQESNFDPTATSPAGARGLAQLMPGTAAGLGVTDPFDPAQSIDAGARYLRSQLDRFGGDPAKALAAYNAGPGAVQRYGGVPPYAETQQYVQRVLGYAAQYRGPGTGAATASPLPYSTV
jgi:soluble lytic murein transglycosylase-like protein